MSYRFLNFLIASHKVVGYLSLVAAVLCIVVPPFALGIDNITSTSSITILIGLGYALTCAFYCFLFVAIASLFVNISSNTDTIVAYLKTSVNNQSKPMYEEIKTQREESSTIDQWMKKNSDKNINDYYSKD